MEVCGLEFEGFGHGAVGLRLSRQLLLHFPPWLQPFPKTLMSKWWDLQAVQVCLQPEPTALPTVTPRPSVP